MWYFILYVLIAIIGIAVINRLREDNIITDEDTDIDELSDYEAAFLGCVFWPIAIVIIIVGFIICCIYKPIYYVIDKIYTKIIYFVRKRNNKTL